MNEIEKLYELSLVNPEATRCIDIFEHLPVLRQYASECSHVTEMGVRWGASTLAFIMANPDRLISYDIQSTRELENILQHTLSNHTFILGDTLKIDIEPTELLFIDTLHTYNQLKLELERHAGKVSKYIILHDTTTFGRVDEDIYYHASNEVKSLPKGKLGLRTAMEDFLIDNPEWVMYKDLTNNNGLSILKRI